MWSPGSSAEGIMSQIYLSLQQVQNLQGLNMKEVKWSEQEQAKLYIIKH